MRVFGNVGAFKKIKEKNPNLVICICGCMMQEEKVVDKIKRSFYYVDIVFGTHNIENFPVLLLKKLRGQKRVFEVLKGSENIAEGLPVLRSSKSSAKVTIMYGCNNFCSYCIVPYVRGREHSREPEEILCEIRNLVRDGVREVMLLGQNVNSYGKGLPEDKACSFAQLLGQIAQINGLDRVRFMTSHPKDLSDELIAVMAKYPNICRHLHLPLQSGSTGILKKMNRRYTKETYLALVDRIRKAIPDISLTTDIIVGFPGETEEDFQETMDVVRRVRFDSAFTFLYSRRSGTPAADMEQVPEDVMKDRFDRLLALVQKIGREQTARFEGRTMDVLVEQVNEHDDSLVTGRLDNNTVVHFPGTADLIGQIVPVHLDICQGFYYMGTRA